MDHISISEEIIPIVAIGGGILVAIVAIVCGTLLSMYRIYRLSSLKQMMLEAGLPPYDIERVINSGSDELKGKSCGGKKPGGI